MRFWVKNAESHRRIISDRDVNPKPFQTGRNDFDDVIKKFVIVGLPVALSAILKITECFSCHAEDAISARNCGKFCEIVR